MIRIATRSSPLARWQSELVATRLAAAGVAAELVPVDTLGDRTQSLGTPLHQLGGQGVFVKEVQAAVLDGRADLAVHSAKDLPSAPTDGLVIGAVPMRDDVRDGLVGATLDALRPGAVVASGSVRRRAQLAHLRPDLRFVEVRGNMATRVAKADEPGVDAVVVGVAGVERIGLGATWRSGSTPSTRASRRSGRRRSRSSAGPTNDVSLALLGAIDDAEAHVAVIAERAFLAELGSGCTLPVAAWCRPVSSIWTMTGLVAAVDGTDVVKGSASRAALDPFDAAELGRGLAHDLLAAGARELLDRA